MIAVAVAGCAALAGPASALADGGGNIPFIQYQNAFGGNVENLSVGTPLQLNYVDPSGQTQVSQYCWTPAPIGRPACSSSAFGAPSQTQRASRRPSRPGGGGRRGSARLSGRRGSR